MINPTIPVSYNHPMNGVTQTSAAGLRSNKFIKLVFTIQIRRSRITDIHDAKLKSLYMNFMI